MKAAEIEQKHPDKSGSMKDEVWESERTMVKENGVYSRRYERDMKTCLKCGAEYHIYKNTPTPTSYYCWRTLCRKCSAITKPTKNYKKTETKSNRSELVKIKRKTRTNATCKLCGETNFLHLHHQDRDRCNNNPENLVWLCESCHEAQHHIKKHVRIDDFFKVD
ncbi:MAG: hypothetical protein KAJ19_12335 [Gammaproteobacteria bacterium]|nr:hypothetical protein [Gammaproteobacteria bacterium]